MMKDERHFIIKYIRFQRHSAFSQIQMPFKACNSTNDQTFYKFHGMKVYMKRKNTKWMPHHADVNPVIHP